jgi:hypothetical protein
MEESEKAGLTLNLKKTKIMTTGTTGEFALGGTKVELTDCYIFLGSIISRDGSDSKEINRRLTMERVAIAKLDKILKDSDITKGTKIKIVETLVFPVVTYGSESWTVRKRDRKRIEAFELWTWRRMLRIPWTARRTNLSVVEEVKPKRTLEATILRQKITIFRSCYESKTITGTRHYAWSSCRIQETGEATDALGGRHQGSHWPTDGGTKGSSPGQEKME